MSFIQFQDIHEAARLRGTERPSMLSMVHDVVAGVLLGQRAAGERAAALHRLLPDDHELHDLPAPRGQQTLRWQLEYLRAAQSFFEDPLVTYQGKDLALSSLKLNTAMVLGSDPVRLAARLHGQCEVNCWVEGPHRGWLADVIAAGLNSGLYHDGCGWEDVATLLHRRDDVPVVVTFGESFPSMWASRTAWPAAADVEADTDDLSEMWEELPAAEQWHHGMQALRLRGELGLEIRPDWATYRFGHELSFLDLLADDCESRLSRFLRS